VRFHFFWQIELGVIASPIRRQKAIAVPISTTSKRSLFDCISKCVSYIG
jgi:hypothetical protein